MAEAVCMDITLELPSLKQKFLVDLVNGIDVNRDHIRVQKDSSGFFARLWGAYTGESYTRQNQINENIIEGLDSCLTWLNNLTEQVTFTNNALVQVNEGLGKVKHDLARVAHFAADTRDQLEALQRTVDDRCTELEARIQQIDMRQRAYQQMDSLMTSWGAGNYYSLSLGQRCFLVASELAWGVFGDYCKVANQTDREQILRNLRDRLTIQINQDARVAPTTRLVSDVWLQPDRQPDAQGHDYQLAVKYLGNRIDPEYQVFTHFVLNPHLDHPLQVPYLMDGSRLIKGMANDLLRDGVLYVS